MDIDTRLALASNIIEGAGLVLAISQWVVHPQLQTSKSLLKKIKNQKHELLLELRENEPGMAVGSVNTLLDEYDVVDAKLQNFANTLASARWYRVYIWSLRGIQAEFKTLRHRTRQESDRAIRGEIGHSVQYRAEDTAAVHGQLKDAVRKRQASKEHPTVTDDSSGGATASKPLGEGVHNITNQPLRHRKSFPHAEDEIVGGILQSTENAVGSSSTAANPFLDSAATAKPPITPPATPPKVQRAKSTIVPPGKGKEVYEMTKDAGKMAKDPGDIV
ncbi:hypothetical protein C8F04DRAFT_470718 [Mycena alexandri]|uniref:Uncharacterized protein n=1 Tax=Mycena alexandri TaxID=1745969 RepID=A0AAD6RZ64_9AGAR|nr:hypothetical protein C8F04DRAFT_470718 [Mycena alexandri]